MLLSASVLPVRSAVVTYGRPVRLRHLFTHTYLCVDMAQNAEAQKNCFKVRSSLYASERRWIRGQKSIEVFVPVSPPILFPNISF